MTFNITTIERKTRKIKPGDPDFMLPDGLMFVPRAMITVSDKCPTRWHKLIYAAVLNGWIEPVAYAALGEKE